MNSLQDKLIELWGRQHPFVCFRVPNSEEVIVYYQNKNTLYSTNDMLVSGFIMSPFLQTEETYYIPDDLNETFLRKNISLCEKQEFQIKEEASKKTDFIELIKRAKEQIYSGVFNKVVVSRHSTFPSKKKPVNLFLALENLYPETLVYLWHHPKVGTWLGASPEQLVNATAKETKTMSLAGTQLYNQHKPSKWTAKEYEEQAMVTKEMTNDLKTIFPSDQIFIKGPLSLRTGNLLHLCTHFKMPGLKVPLQSLINTLHPTPAVGGLPKEKAIEFIKSEEGYNRLFYTGFLGIITKEKKHLFVNLRCGQWKNGKLTLFVGAGITEGSIPENEWIETQRKATTLFRIL